jgi:hypothetical protein
MHVPLVIGGFVAGGCLAWFWQGDTAQVVVDGTATESAFTPNSNVTILERAIPPPPAASYAKAASSSAPSSRAIRLTER